VGLGDMAYWAWTMDCIDRSQSCKFCLLSRGEFFIYRPCNQTFWAITWLVFKKKRNCERKRHKICLSQNSKDFFMFVKFLHAYLLFVNLNRTVKEFLNIHHLIFHDLNIFKSSLDCLKKNK